MLGSRKKKLEEVLNLVNEGRRALGLRPLSDLPKGYRGSSISCPIAQAFDRYIDVGPYSARGNSVIIHKLANTWKSGIYGREHVYLPGALRRWIRDFDNGKYKQYRKE